MATIRPYNEASAEELALLLQRVVVVDDDTFMSELLSTMLRSLGVRDVVCVSDGRAALRALAEDSSGMQILLCDLRMPGMDGIELIRHLAGHRACYGVGLLSGEDERILVSAKELALAHGVRVLGMLRKPVTRAHLEQMLCQIAARRPSSAGLTARSNGIQVTAEDLARGIAAGELVVYYQPRIRLSVERRVSGVEGLVRWQHPKLGLIPPGAFLPMAEQSGLVDALTHAVFERALGDLAQWQRAGLELVMSLNATVDTLARLDFADQVAAQAATHKVPLASLIVEVTEGRLITHFEKVLETLTRLRLNRVGVAIDDFGTGYSTMEQLQRIPFTELKIDRAFVRGAHEDKTTRAILESSVRLARQLTLTSVAEGAETLEDLSLVETVGCDEVQGYFLARPMPQAEIAPFIASFQLPRARVSGAPR
jgi:EAL domain-containing protein (putative c-di-GMP-specific phosphodiesterase class I)/CheY-like chemotaxis protein